MRPNRKGRETEFLTLALNTLDMLGKQTQWDEPQNALKGLDAPRRKTRLDS